MMQVPFQRRQQAMEQQRIGLEGRQIDNQYQIKQAILQLQAQRANDLAGYHEGLIDAKNQGLQNSSLLNDERAQHWSDRLAFQQQQANIMDQLKQATAWQNDYKAVPGGMLQHMPGGNPVQSSSAGSFGMPQEGGVTQPWTQFTPTPHTAAPLNASAQLRNQLEMIKLRGMIGGTNEYPNLMQQLNQLQNGGLQPSVQQAVPRVKTYNPATGGLD
jgi:hypothetical protein